MNVCADTPLWIASRTLLAARQHEFFRQWGNVRKAFEAEPIHDLRVASRRLREGLQLFACCYPRKRLSGVMRRVRGVTRLLGDVRNTDEAISYFTALAGSIASADVAEPLQLRVAAMQKERDREARRLRTVLTTLSRRDLRDEFARTLGRPLIFAGNPGSCDPCTTMDRFARLSVAERLAVMPELVDAASVEEDIAAQHRLRIAVKHFRYRMEILSFLFSPGYGELYADVKGYQEVLGKLHDLDVFAGMVSAWSLPARTEAAILDAIARERHGKYGSFLELMERSPVTGFEERLWGAI